MNMQDLSTWLTDHREQKIPLESGKYIVKEEKLEWKRQQGVIPLRIILVDPNQASTSQCIVVDIIRHLDSWRLTYFDHYRNRSFSCDQKSLRNIQLLIDQL